MQLSVSHREKCYVPQASGTPGACVRQDAGLGEQMHRALGQSCAKWLCIGRHCVHVLQASRALDCSRTRRVPSFCLKLTQTCYALPEAFILCSGD